MESFPSFSDLTSISKPLETETDTELIEAALAWADTPSSNPTFTPLSIEPNTPGKLIDISEFDPFTTTATKGSLPLPSLSLPAVIPIYSTLGATVQSTSKLILVSDDEEEGEEDGEDGVEGRLSSSSFSRAGENDAKDLRKLEKKGISGIGSGRFLGGMFKRDSTELEKGESRESGGGGGEGGEKVELQFNEKALPLLVDPPLPTPPTVGLPTYSQEHSIGSESPMRGAMGISNPLASITSIFRSATASPVTPVKDKPSSIDVKGKGKDLGEITFDFNRFLGEMRSRSADSIAKYLRSFLKEFSRRPPVSSTDQIRVINDFLDFIAEKMRGVDPWKSVLEKETPERGEAEFDMALEAMEKLVMNRVWHLTFTPAIDLTTLPQHVSPTDDLERDHVLAQRIRLFAWILPCHLDLPISAEKTEEAVEASPLLVSLEEEPPLLSPGTKESQKVESRVKQKGKQTQGFLDFGKRELNKINLYKAPRDKLICVLNACKVIFGLIRHVSSDEGADSFIPFLIYIVLKANPEHLVSNLQYIQRFRNPEKLSGEGGYYLSSLNGAISFIETLDASSLSNITQAEFETNVATAIASFPKDPAEHKLPPSPTTERFPRSPPNINTTIPTIIDDSESPALIQPMEEGGNNNSFGRNFNFFKSTEAVISKPLEAIGRIFEQLENFGEGGEKEKERESRAEGERDFGKGSGRALSIRSNRSGRSGRGMREDYLGGGESGRGGEGGRRSGEFGVVEEERLRGELVAIDASVEQQRLSSLDTLKNIFPGIEMQVLEMVFLSNGNNLPKTIESLLEM